MLEPDPATRVVPTHAGTPGVSAGPHTLQILTTEHWSLLAAQPRLHGGDEPGPDLRRLTGSVVALALVVGLALDLGIGGSLALGGAFFLVSIAIFVAWARRVITGYREQLTPLFPSPPPAD